VLSFCRNQNVLGADFPKPLFKNKSDISELNLKGKKDNSTHSYHQGCQIFIYLIYQNVGNFFKLPLHYIPKGRKYTKMAVIYSQWPYNIPTFFHSKALQNLPKFGFLVWKHTIWQSFISLSVEMIFVFCRRFVLPCVIYGWWKCTYYSHTCPQTTLRYHFLAILSKKRVFVINLSNGHQFICILHGRETYIQKGKK
jgi:hypothetical protein